MPNQRTGCAGSLCGLAITTAPRCRVPTIIYGTYAVVGDRRSPGHTNLPVAPCRLLAGSWRAPGWFVAGPGTGPAQPGTPARQPAAGVAQERSVVPAQGRTSVSGSGPDLGFRQRRRLGGRVLLQPAQRLLDRPVQLGVGGVEDLGRRVHHFDVRIHPVVLHAPAFPGDPGGISRLGHRGAVDQVVAAVDADPPAPGAHPDHWAHPECLRGGVDDVAV